MNADSHGRPNAGLLEFFCRHLVGLCVTYRHNTSEDKGRPARFAACSGTLIIIQNTLMYLTAGHVLKELDELRQHDQVEIINAALADTWGWKRISDLPIPFDLKNTDLFYVDDREAGLDFGVFTLGCHYARLLAENGMVALTEESWVHQHEIEFDGYAMLGFPEEFTTERLSSSGDVSVSPVLFSVKRLQSAPNDRAPTRLPQFIGQLESDNPLRSVKGMSGGPIIGFKLEPGPRYWIVAVQSSWDRKRRIVYGCELPVLASLMSKWADEQLPAV